MNFAKDDKKKEIELFISHAEDDVQIAELLVQAIECGFEIPEGALRCTSVRKYGLNFGEVPRDSLRDDLSQTKCFVAVLTPRSISRPWCLCEMGAAWITAAKTFTLRAGKLKKEKIPGPLGQPLAACLEDPADLDHFLRTLGEDLRWPEKNLSRTTEKFQRLADFVMNETFEETILKPAFDRQVVDFVDNLSDDERRILRKLFGYKQGLTLAEVSYRKLVNLSPLTAQKQCPTDWVTIVNDLVTKRLVKEIWSIGVASTYSLTRPLGEKVAEACIWRILEETGVSGVGS